MDINVAAGIVWRGHCFLAGQRRTGSPLEGYWEFPGGKLEGTETPQEALCRELAEELGIGVRSATFWKQVKHRYVERALTVTLHIFHVTDFTGEPCGKEGQNLRWVTRAEALELDFLPADKTLLCELQHDLQMTTHARYGE
ncbi:MAG: (deoxy)nucleoside triphosphate pyrophosphohydrolase [Desulfovibrio sp.]|nr:(deoxy)nucleoside triphosphate pyrophosphohydrolase [Desulfovibrio sp.]